MEFDINPNELSLQGPDGMQLVQILRKLIVAIDGGDEPEPVETSGLYYCTYGTTTSAQIAQAITDGLLPVCVYGGKYYYLAYRQVNIFTFASVDQTQLILYRIKCNGSNWSFNSSYLQSLLDFDYAPTQGSTNPVTSGGVWTAIQQGGGGSDIDPYQQNPAMDGTASPGSSDNYARGDHVHPTDTSRAAASEITRIDAALATKADSATMEQDIEDAVDDWLSVQAPSIGTLSYAAKQALLACFRKVAWIDDQGQSYYNALESELFPDATLESITALFTQGSAMIFNTDSLDSLRQYLVVTANFSDSTTETITLYELSGTLTAGTSTITVSYGGKTTTFNVTVSNWDINWDYTMGNPSVAGLNVEVGSAISSATMEADGLHVYSKDSVIIARTTTFTATHGVAEFDLTFTTMPMFYQGLFFGMSDGTHGARMRIYDNKITFGYASTNDEEHTETIYSGIAVNTSYRLRFEWDISNGFILSINGVTVYTLNHTLDSTNTRLVMTAVGSTNEGYTNAYTLRTYRAKAVS